MEPFEILEISKESLMVLLKISTPILMIALATGLIISLIQALTQIQEATLSFVPKIIVLFISLIFLVPNMVSQLKNLFENIMNAIIGI